MKTRRADKADMERLDLLFLHGGMVAINEIGIALLGPPKSGKTSTSLARLGAAAASHVAENDLAVDCTGSQAVGLGWPRSICLRGDTLDDLDAVFPVLRPQIPALTHPYSGQCGADGNQPDRAGAAGDGQRERLEL